MLSDDVSTRPVPAPDFDRAVMATLVAELGGDDALRDELVAGYRPDAEERIGVLRAAAAAGDRDAVRSASHGLRSSSQVLGLTRLAQLLATLEAVARRPDEDLDAPVAEVLHAHAAAGRALSAALPQNGAAGD